MVKKEELFYDSRDGISKIYAVKWLPDGKPKCILQIIHGMAEHIECYGDFASSMAEQGILAVGEDHLGHGKSVSAGGTNGYFCKDEASTVVVRDVHRLKKMVQEDNPGVPYLILGHSMGSVILRNYLLRYGTGIDGAIIVGTGIKPKPLLKISRGLACILAVFQGWKHQSHLLDKLAFGNYNKRIQNPVTGFDWICSEKKRVDSYIADPKCGFIFTLNGFHTLFTLFDCVTDTKELQRMPKELPILITSGNEDPVGDYGEGVKILYEQYKSMGMKRAEIRMYNGFRHEILNETGKKEVYIDILQWINSVLKDKEMV